MVFALQHMHIYLLEIDKSKIALQVLDILEQVWGEIFIFSITHSKQWNIQPQLAQGGSALAG